MTESKKRGPYAKGEARRQEILNRALEIFAERGSANMSMRAIAVELGVSHSAIQHYFGSIEEILVEVIELRDERSRRAGDGPPIELLREQLHRGATANSETPGLTALYTNLLGTSVEAGNDISREYFTRRFSDGRAELQRAIEDGRAEGTVPPGPDAARIAALVMAAFDGLQVQWLLDPEVDIRGTLALLDGLLGDASATPAHGAGVAGSPAAESGAA